MTEMIFQVCGDCQKGLLAVTGCRSPSRSANPKRADISELKREAWGISEDVRGSGLNSAKRSRVDAEVSALRERVQQLVKRLSLKDQLLNGYRADLKRLNSRVEWLEQMVAYHASKARYMEAERIKSEIKAEASKLVARRERARADHAQREAKMQNRKTGGGIDSSLNYNPIPASKNLSYGAGGLAEKFASDPGKFTNG